MKNNNTIFWLNVINNNNDIILQLVLKKQRAYKNIGKIIIKIMIIIKQR